MAVIEGSMTIGTLTAFMAYVGLFFSPIQQISSLWTNYKSSQASYDRLSEITNLKKEISNKKPLVITNGEIHFDNVCFSYNDRIILKDFNAVFLQGMNYLVGDNGTGKTTILNLISCLYVPDRGEIIIDGQKLSQTNIGSLRKCIAIVFSDSIIFDGTIFENILIGNFSATKNDVIDAAKKAGLHEFVMKLSKQYNSDVGESGLSLSSGEKQKIALARVILSDSPIIIFDEFTRSIDAESKKAIYSVIRQLKNKTIIIITHDTRDIEPDGKIISLGDGLFSDSNYVR